MVCSPRVPTRVLLTVQLRPMATAAHRILRCGAPHAMRTPRCDRFRAAAAAFATLKQHDKAAAMLGEAEKRAPDNIDLSIEFAVMLPRIDKVRVLRLLQRWRGRA